VHHVGLHSQLEDQLMTWDPLATSKSPDRLDALVWALTDLMLDVPQRNYGLVTVHVIG
jgi:phage terminase large subunit-like protein